MLLWGLLAGQAMGSVPQSEFTDQERRSNWFPSFSEFGSLGSGPGQLLFPRSLAVGSDERIFVADSGNHRIQVYSIEGRLLRSWGVLGSGPGEFRFPAGVAVGPMDEIYVTDTGNDRVQVFTSQGVFLRQWGSPGIALGQFSRPQAIAVMKDQVCVVEGGNPRVQVFSPEGKPLLSFGTFGERPGEFKEPSGIALDEDGQIYVVEAGNHRIQKFDPAGKVLQQWGAWGYPEGLLSAPGGLAYAKGRLYVADTANHRIQVFDRSGTFLWQWGAAPPVPHGGRGRLHFPGAIAVAPTGARAVVCEPVEHRCQVFSLGNARSAALVNDLPWWEGLHARFHAAMFPVLPVNPNREIGRWGRSPPVLVAMPEQESHFVLFFDISLRPCYLVTRMGGVGRRLGEFRWPSGLTVDGRTGRFFVCDRGNRRVQILELLRDPKSTTGFVRTVRVISAFAPNQLVPNSLKGYHSECATLDGLALDPEGNVLVADASNGVVLKFDPEGQFIRGIPDPSAPGASLERPVGVAVSPDGKTVYTVDQNGFRIVAHTSDGVYRFSWGQRGAQGENNFLLPTAVAVDGDGFVYVADAGQQVIKKFDSQGKFVLQWGRYGSEEGQFSSPTGILFISPKRIVVEDFANHRGQVFTPEGEFLAFFYKGGKSSPFPAR